MIIFFMFSEAQTPSLASGVFLDIAFVGETPGGQKHGRSKTVQYNDITKAGTRCKLMTGIANGY